MPPDMPPVRGGLRGPRPTRAGAQGPLPLLAPAEPPRSSPPAGFLPVLGFMMGFRVGGPAVILDLLLTLTLILILIFILSLILFLGIMIFLRMDRSMIFLLMILLGFTVFLLLGGFIIAMAIQRWNLHARIALNIVARFGARPKALIFGFMLAAALLSMWISNTATTIMMTPIALSVAMAAGRAGIPPVVREN